MEREIIIQFGIIKRLDCTLIYFSKVNELEDEGVIQPTLRHRIFNIHTHNQKKLLQTDTEIMLTNMYVFYVKKVFHGINVNKTKEGGFTPKMFHMSIF
jgi:hypothetical protein